MITHTCPVCDKLITIDLSLDHNNFAYCFHNEDRCWYYIHTNTDQGWIFKTELQIEWSNKWDYITIAQFPIIKETVIIGITKRGDNKILLHLDSLMTIDYKNIPKLKEKILTYLLFS